VIRERFEALDAWLTEMEPVWSHRPFVALPAPWEPDHTDVSAWLRSLTPEQVRSYDDAPATLADGPLGMRHWVQRGHELTALPDAARHATPVLPVRWKRSVPGRKCAQVAAFAGALAGWQEAAPARFIDWCAGKGHLGRALGLLRNVPITFVEKQPRLAKLALERAEAEGVSARAEVADVLTSPLALQGDALVALHACGALSDRAIELARTTVPSLALAPCCFHFHPGRQQVARSQRGQSSSLHIAPQQLRFATAEEVGAPARRRLGRAREEAFRLALDLLLRERSGEDRYHHVRTVPRPWVRAPFGDWARRVAAHAELTLPAQFDATRIEAAGWRRARIARAMDLARVPFRRCLELWYLYDRALWLEESGYSVRLSQMCERRITPRNVVLFADA
jgi:Methyltransferase domain